MSWLGELWARVRRWLGGAPPPAVSAAEAMRQLRLEKRAEAAGPQDWDALVARFEALVFGAPDRTRLWRRHGRRWGRTLRPLAEIDRPTAEEAAALRELVEELARGR